MVTFPVADVPLGELYEPLDAERSIRSLLVKRVEAMARPAGRLVSCDTVHAFAKAAHDAFYNHLPLTIRPDDVWFCIAQGFATHVGQNSEELRSRFVRHAGKKRLVVERADFLLGCENPWPEAFAAFSDQIGAHVGTLKDLVSARFSTSTETEIAAFDICLMDTFQGYFEYEMRAGCGIPAITLLGTAEDWASMIPRVKYLAEFGLETWTETLVPVLTKIAETAAGKVDSDFWSSFFRYQSGSGPAELTGWIVTLFPYLVQDWRTKALAPNAHLATWQEGWEAARRRGDRFLHFGDVHGPSINAIPESLVSAPVRYVDLSNGGAEHDLRFVAGLFGVEQDVETRALAACFGWAVIYD